MDRHKGVRLAQPERQPPLSECGRQTPPMERPLVDAGQVGSVIDPDP